MGLLLLLIESFNGIWIPQQSIPRHTKKQAYGSHHSKRRRRPIAGYRWRKPRSRYR